MKRVYVISAKRTAIGSLGGIFKSVSAVNLGVEVVKNIISESNINPSDVNEVIFGNVLSAGLGQNIARQISLNSGIPDHVSAYTVNKVCGSGMKSVQLAYQSIASGEADLVIAGGTENMSQAPYLSKNMRFGSKYGDVGMEDSIIKDGLWCSFNDYHMGITAENIAERYSISREEQDKFAVSSQHKVGKAIENNEFEDEILKINVQSGKNSFEAYKDEFPRPDTTLEKLAKLKPAFKKDGTVTAGNASGVNDGAAGLLLASEDYISKHNITPIAEIKGFASAGLSPDVMGLGPVFAINKLIEKTGIKLSDIELFELNEAFAVQSLAVLKDLKINPDKVNVNGGAVALGHPIGASGSRIIVTLLNAMKRRNLTKGIASLCIGGGMGIAMMVEMEIK